LYYGAILCSDGLVQLHPHFEVASLEEDLVETAAAVGALEGLL
jgi:hypothetical protein